MTPVGGEQTSTPAPSGCVVPEDWTPYTIQSGDTLFRLALRWGVTVDELADANCIEDRNNITTGQIIYAPPGSNVTPSPQLTPGVQTTSTPTRIENMSSFDCGNPDATITSPAAGTILSGTVGIYGTAKYPDFQFYRIKISGSCTTDSDLATRN